MNWVEVFKKCPNGKFFLCLKNASEGLSFTFYKKEWQEFLKQYLSEVVILSTKAKCDDVLYFLESIDYF